MEKVIICKDKLKSLKGGLIDYLKKAYEYHGSDENQIPHIVREHILRGDAKRCGKVMAMVNDVAAEYGEYTFEDIADAIIKTSVMAIRKGGQVLMSNRYDNKLKTTWED